MQLPPQRQQLPTPSRRGVRRRSAELGGGHCYLGRCFIGPSGVPGHCDLSSGLHSQPLFLLNLLLLQDRARETTHGVSAVPGGGSERTRPTLTDGMGTRRKQQRVARKNGRGAQAPSASPGDPGIASVQRHVHSQHSCREGKDGWEGRQTLRETEDEPRQSVFSYAHVYSEQSRATPTNPSSASSGRGTSQGRACTCTQAPSPPPPGTPQHVLGQASNLASDLPKRLSAGFLLTFSLTRASPPRGN